MDSKEILNIIKTKIGDIKNPEFLQNLGKEKIQAILIAAALIVVLDVFFLLRGQITKITKEYIPKKKNLIQQLTEVKRGVTTSPKVQDKLQQLETNVEASLAQLTNEEDIPEFLSWISQLANENKVKLMEIKPLKGVESQDRYYLLPIGLTLESGYHQFGSFLNQLEQGNYFVRLSDLSIRASSKSNVTHIINLGLETFVLKE